MSWRGGAGIEPAYNGFGDRSHTGRPPPRIFKNEEQYLSHMKEVVGALRIELKAFSCQAYSPREEPPQKTKNFCVKSTNPQIR